MPIFVFDAHDVEAIIQYLQSVKYRSSSPSSAIEIQVLPFGGKQQL